MFWSYVPQYDLRVRQGMTQPGTARRTWSLATLQSASATLYTAGGVPEAQVTLLDPDRVIRDRVNPQPMDQIELDLGTRFAQAGTPPLLRAWTGYVDTFSFSKDASQGDSVQIAARGPIKIFEQKRQTATDVGWLALSSTANLRGSAILRYAARAVRYPAQMLVIDPRTDTGTGFQQFSAGALTSPDQQPWSSPLSQVQENGGIEWYFDEYGYLFWREVGFISPFNPVRSTAPVSIPAEDIFQVDYGISDQGAADESVITHVEVRYFGNDFLTGATAGRYPRTYTPGQTALETQMGVRALIVPAVWIKTKAAADYLARILYTQYSAGIATASVTIPANPQIGIGTLVDLPALDVPMPLDIAGRMAGPATRYYVTSITYQLDWGGMWAMTLGLNYGRSRGADFPYTGTEAFPTLTAQVVAGMQLSDGVTGYVPALNPSNLAQVDTPYTLQTQSGLKKNQLSHSGFPPGTVLQLWSKPHSGGRPVGDAPAATYTVVAADSSQSTSVFGIGTLPKTTKVWVTIQSYQAPANDSTNPAGPDPLLDGTALPTQSVSADYSGPATTVAQRALTKALTLNGQPYSPGCAGPDYWDCSGCVSWAYWQLGVSGLVFPGSPENGDVGPNGLYYFFLQHGARSIDVSQTQPGDLLFIVEPGPVSNADGMPGYPNSQDGFSHVAFCLVAGATGTNFSGQNKEAGVCAMNTAGFTSYYGTAFNRALDLSHIRLAG